MSKLHRKIYSYSFLVPAAIVYIIIFIVPTFLSFFFSLTRWTLSDWEYIGLDNFITFFKEPYLSIGFRNTFIYAVVTCGLKVVLGLLLGVLLTGALRIKNYLRSVVFFPTLVSTIAVGITFSVMMHPTTGLINETLSFFGIKGPDWLGNPSIALLSVAMVDVWKGVGFATVIYIAGIMSIPEQYYEALQIDGGGSWHKFWHIILPLSRPATNSVIILAFIGGLRSFDLIWAMTKGGPGFSTDVIASIIYKQYQAGFYGLSTAGNVILFLFVSLLAFPLSRFLTRKEVDL
ncbi:MAG: sugar ABC transporter permease [Thermobacillus sp.]|uniref:Permease component of ABC-type sugar transporter n=1 Tax=Thermobacillus composti (strain DSM 18247 / JCM 13945 / KWC4) TaxID=717605 RepID=L0EI93_THECK|nr:MULTISPECIES: sugar ABC transporter permease [Thermobacillus]AGA59406.1 permease component of ABC-type sugar transporter [Thermobacillus composti KWC4]REJ16148.1 MAG: sugar ABC transporter permease [Paenibacillaceae bacterium]REK58410.1 MAG: sugar ABC transporter permease [Thermobacillus sp.]